MSIPFIDLKTPYQNLKAEIDERIHNVLNHGFYVMGSEVKEAEKALADYAGVKHALTCSSGTDALTMALMGLGVGPGDEVITTAFSFIATAETIVLAGATPVYVDINPVTYNIDADKIEEAISDKTKAIMPVSLYGQTPDMNAINAIAARHGLPVIEDAAQSFGAEYKGKKSCNLSTVGCTSFFPAKPLGCFGDGGAVFTDDSDLALKMEEIRNHGQESRYYHTQIGINGRMDTIQCAVILAKLGKYEWEVQQRQAVGERYNEAFMPLMEKGVVAPKVLEGHTSAWAQYTLAVPNREEFQAKLQEAGVPSSIHYPITMADQPAYKDRGRCMDITHARKAAEQVISLPIHPYLTQEHQDKIISAVKAST